MASGCYHVTRIFAFLLNSLTDHYRKYSFFYYYYFFSFTFAFSFLFSFFFVIHFAFFSLTMISTSI